MPAKIKEVYLAHLLGQLEDLKVRSAMVFCSTCKGCRLLSYVLEELGIGCSALHSHQSQGRRLAALDKYAPPAHWHDSTACACHSPASLSTHLCQFPIQQGFGPLAGPAASCSRGFLQGAQAAAWACIACRAAPALPDLWNSRQCVCCQVSQRACPPAASNRCGQQGPGHSCSGCCHQLRPSHAGARLCASCGAHSSCWQARMGCQLRDSGRPAAVQECKGHLAVIFLTVSFGTGLAWTMLRTFQQRVHKLLCLIHCQPF